MKLFVSALSFIVVILNPFSLNSQVKEEKTLDNGVRIYPAQGVEEVKDKPVPSQKVIIIDQMDLIQATEMLSVLKSKAEFAQGEDKVNYEKQIVLVEDRIKKLNTQKN